METAGGPQLHRPALVPALHRLLRRHGNQNCCISTTHSHTTVLQYYYSNYTSLVPTLNTAPLYTTPVLQSNMSIYSTGTVPQKGLFKGNRGERIDQPIMVQTPTVTLIGLSCKTAVNTNISAAPHNNKLIYFSVLH